MRRLLGLYTLVYRSPNNSIIDMHPDFIKSATSEQSLFVGIKLELPLFAHTPLASQRSAKAKAKSFEQVSSRRAQPAGPYSTPSRLRMKFKADMVDETVSSVLDSNPALQPFGAPRVVEAALAEPSPLTPVSRVRARSPSPVEGFVFDATVLRGTRCFKLHANVSEGTLRTFAETDFFCAAIGEVCVKFRKPRRP